MCGPAGSVFARATTACVASADLYLFYFKFHTTNSNIVITVYIMEFEIEHITVDGIGELLKSLDVNYHCFHLAK